MLSLESRSAKGKRGVSAVVAMVLIILITTSAAAVIWVAIVPTIRDQLDGEFTCLDAANALTIMDVGFTCKSEQGLHVQIRRGPHAIEIKDIEIIASVGGDSESLSLIAAGIAVQGDLPARNGAEVFAIPSERWGSLSAAEIETVRVAAVIRMGNEDRSCDAGSTVGVGNCA